MTDITEPQHRELPNPLEDSDYLDAKSLEELRDLDRRTYKSICNLEDFREKILAAIDRKEESGE
jgi:hypothetical protein